MSTVARPTAENLSLLKGDIKLTKRSAGTPITRLRAAGTDPYLSERGCKDMHDWAHSRPLFG